MRKLNPSELANIRTRLESLQINYTEVYEEILDHYHTALESSSESDANELIQKLNKDFSRGIVKKMERELLKASKKQVTKMQIESFKFWKYDIRTSISFISLSTISVLIALLFGKYLLSVWVGLIVITGLVLMFTKDKAIFRYNLAFWNRGSVGAVNQLIYSRLGFLSGFGIMSIFNIQYVELDRIHLYGNSFDLFNISLLAVLIYSLSLYRIVLSQDFNSKTKLRSN